VKPRFDQTSAHSIHKMQKFSNHIQKLTVSALSMSQFTNGHILPTLLMWVSSIQHQFKPICPKVFYA
jgi:hypothetical protein